MPSNWKDSTVKLIYNGKIYFNGDNITVNVGDTIAISMTGTEQYVRMYIYVNGSSVKTGSGNDTTITYTYTVSNSIDITFTYDHDPRSSKDYIYIVDSTAEAGFDYNISEGNCLINSCKYKIGKGKTLSSGAVYDIASPITLSITGDGSSYGTTSIATVCYIVVDGVQYSTSQTIKVLYGQTIELHLQIASGISTSKGIITIDGETVVNTHYPNQYTYLYTVTDNAIIELAPRADWYNGMYYSGSIIITTS